MAEYEDTKSEARFARLRDAALKYYLCTCTRSADKRRRDLDAEFAQALKDAWAVGEYPQYDFDEQDEQEDEQP